MASTTRGTKLLFVAALSTLLLAAAAPLPAQQLAADQTTRVVAIGDIHGDFEAFVSILQQSGLVDESRHWIGGTATLVQTGDFTDRGSEVRAVMDLLMALEEQAKSAGGRVVVLLGNHEVMNLMRHVRDVNPQAYASFADSESEGRRKAAYRAYERLRMARLAASVTSDDLQKTKQEWMTAHPPGFLEYQEALGPRGRYGRWLRAKPVAVQLGDSIFLHAGISPELATLSLDEINKQVRRELQAFDAYQRVLIERKLTLPSFTLEEILAAAQAALDGARRVASPGGGRNQSWRSVLDNVQKVGGGFALHPDGPLWFRGYATWTEGEGAGRVTSLLHGYGAARFVVGHTVQTTKAITPRLAGHVFLIDTGMLASRYGGRASALEVQGGRFTAIYPDERVVLLEQSVARLAQ